MTLPRNVKLFGITLFGRPLYKKTPEKLLVPTWMWSEHEQVRSSIVGGPNVNVVPSWTGSEVQHKRARSSTFGPKLNRVRSWWSELRTPKLNVAVTFHFGHFLLGHFPLFWSLFTLVTFHFFVTFHFGHFPLFCHFPLWPLSIFFVTFHIGHTELDIFG